MKIRLNRAFWIKLILILGALSFMPFVAPLAIELVLLADILGLEALLLFLIYQARQGLSALLATLVAWRLHIACTVLLLGSLYFLEPQIALVHLSGSLLILAFGVSCLAVASATLLWLPPLLLSYQQSRYWRPPQPVYSPFTHNFARL